VDLVNGDYALAPTSPYKGAGTDGKDPGADFDALGAATNDVAATGTATGGPPSGCASSAPVTDRRQYHATLGRGRWS